MKPKSVLCLTDIEASNLFKLWYFEKFERIYLKSEVPREKLAQSDYWKAAYQKRIHSLHFAGEYF